MAIRKITNAAYLDSDWQSEIESKNDLKKGLCVLELDTTNRLIKAGSVVEMNGVLYKSDTTTTPSNSVVDDSYYYIYIRDISGTFDFYYSNELPIFNNLKNGWYGTTDTSWRAVAFVYKTSTEYTNVVYEKDFYTEMYPNRYFYSYGSSFTSVGLTSNIKTDTVYYSDDYTYNTSTGELTFKYPGIYKINLSGYTKAVTANGNMNVVAKNASDIAYPGLSMNISIFSTLKILFTLSGIIKITDSGQIIKFVQTTTTSSNLDLYNTSLSVFNISEDSYLSYINTASIIGVVSSTLKLTENVYNSNIIYNSTTGQATIGKSGYYYIDFIAGLKFTTTSGIITATIRKNSVNIPSFRTYLNANTGSIFPLNLKGIVLLNEGDVIDIYIEANTGSGPSFTDSKLNITRIHDENIYGFGNLYKYDLLSSTNNAVYNFDSIGEEFNTLPSTSTDTITIKRDGYYFVCFNTFSMVTPSGSNHDLTTEIRKNSEVVPTNNINFSKTLSSMLRLNSLAQGIVYLSSGDSLKVFSVAEASSHDDWNPTFLIYKL
jgi:hypothetical protein